MMNPSSTNTPVSPLPRQVDQICDRFEGAWKKTLTGAVRPHMEEYLADIAESQRDMLLRELLAVDIGYRQLLGETPTPQDYQQRFPTLPPQWLTQLLTSSDEASAPAAKKLASAPPSLPGYEILRELGRGGMGVVYLARHRQLGRAVALKMILAGSFAAADEVQRFLAEAVAVAQLQHPNIVQLFESGQHNGLPFFALEYIDGGSLADLVKTGPLPPVRAAELIEQLAQGMASAHSRGVVHRDLKPENVLLTADGAAKITDFGLARRVEAGPGLTNTGVIVGTPSYMAPEQASGHGKTAGSAADVYALGAILYRVLTGRPPFQAATALETVMQVRCSEPVPPTQLQPSVPRDLETICLKCLQKEPAKRYASALALAEDLQRFMRHEPILARPVGRWERLAKWAKRRPGAAALAGSLLALMVFVIVGLLIGIGLINDALGQALEAEKQASAARATAENERDAKETQRQIAEKERDAKEKQRQLAVQAAEAETKARAAEELAKQKLEKRLAQVTKAQEILKSIFGDLDTRRAGKDGPALSVKLGERLDKAAKLLDDDAVGDSLDVAELQLWLAKAQLSLGNPKSAVGLLLKARQTFETECGPDHSSTLYSMHNLAKAYQDDGQPKQALALFEETLAKRKLILGPEHVDTLTSMNSLAVAYQRLGQMKQARPLLEQTLARYQKLFGPCHPQTLAVLNNLAAIYQFDGQVKQAIPLYEWTLQKCKVTLEPDHPHTLSIMNNLASAYQADRQLKQALSLYEETLTKRARTLGPDHPDTLASMNNMASAYQDDGQVKKALALFQQTLEKRKRKLEPDHPDTLISMNSLAGAYRADGQIQKALPLYEETLAKRKLKLGPDDVATLASMVNLAMAYRDSGRMTEAIGLLEDVRNRAQKRPGGVPARLAGIPSQLAATYDAARQFAKAEPLHRDLLEQAQKRFEAGDARIGAAQVQLGWNLLQQRKFVAAEAYLRDCLAVCQQKQPDAWYTFSVQTLLGASLLGQKKYEDAEPLLKEGYEGMKQREKTIPPTTKRRLTEVLEHLVQLYEATDNAAEAERYRKELSERKAAEKTPKK
jgi:eukaryotic-like serine/threonine-protein kinase